MLHVRAAVRDRQRGNGTVRRQKDRRCDLSLPPSRRPWLRVCLSFLRRTARKKNIPARAERSANVLYDAAYSSVFSVLLVGGFVCLFYLLADALHSSGALRPAEELFSFVFRDRGAGEAFAGGLIECTRGCAALAALPRSPFAASLAAAIVSSGGASVIAQSLLFLNDSCCDRKIFLLSKALQTAFSFPICYALVSLFSVV